MAMAYLYGKKFVGPITETILALREELYIAYLMTLYRICIPYSDTPIHHRYSYREVSRKKINIINLDTSLYTFDTVSGKYRRRERDQEPHASRARF
jgi:hypothetical protein